MRRDFLRSGSLLSSVILSVAIISGCSVEASKRIDVSADMAETHPASLSETAKPRGARIKIEPNSPADTVRVFYKHLREKKIREAIFLTNLRPAIEGLTDMELKEFQLDFEALAAHVPAEIEINGEIISGDSATVTAKLPGEDEGLELQQIQLRKKDGVWIILTVDEESEKRIRQEGKNYFFSLKIETHQEEAKKMLERISKAQMVYSLQNQGSYADIPVLVESGFLPPDVKSSASTGYNYAVKLLDNNKKYIATATPAAYGKTGKLSYLIDLDPKGAPRLASKDNGGQTLKK